MAEFQVTPEALTEAGARYSAQLAEFERRFFAVSSRVSGVVGASWSGRASQVFGEGWMEIVSGAEDVHAALAGMAKLLPAAAEAYTVSDGAVEAASAAGLGAGST